MRFTCIFMFDLVIPKTTHNHSSNSWCFTTLNYELI